MPRTGNRKLIGFILSMAAFFAVMMIIAIKADGKDLINLPVPLATGIMLISGPFYLANAAVHIKGKQENTEQ